MNIWKKIGGVSCMLILMVFILSTALLVSADQLEATTFGITDGIGNYSIELPISESADQTYDVTLGIVRQYDNGAYVYNSTDEVYYVQVLNADGTQNDSLSAYYKFEISNNNEHDHSELKVIISSVPEGSTLIIHHIQIEKIEYDEWDSPLWTNYSLTYIETIIENTNSDDTNIVLIDDTDRLKQLIVGETISQEAIVVEQEDSAFIRETTDTLLSVHNNLFGTSFTNYEGNDFLTHLLSTYNVVSLDEIHSTHIVGPIISQNIVERTTEDGAVGSYLSAADYSRGVPSYIGEFTTYGTEGSEQVGVQLNYLFDFTQNSSFLVPYLYSDQTNLLIEPKGDVNNLQDYYIVSTEVEDGEDGVEVKSANNTGYTDTYQNDDFIDFSALEAALQNVSEYILENGNAENYEEFIKFEFDSGTAGTVASSVIKVYEGGELVVTITSDNGETYDDRDFESFVSSATYYNTSGTGIRLTINMEESWTIINAVNLEEVNMILPEGYDYYDNPYMAPTTINFYCEYINPATYDIDVNGDGETEPVVHSRMPFTLIDGAEFKETLGENGEYGEVGNKIIWNMPNVVTDSETGDNRLTVLYTSHNIAGHIVAPSAEFWNYDEEGDWLGGNLNGSAIVKSFYSGIMEMHMWAYTGLAEEAVIYGIEALKTVNDTTPDRTYTFLLDVVYEEDGSIPDGIMNNNFPTMATSSVDSGEEGEVQFSSLAFNEAGTYSFIVKEDTSADTATDNVFYDLTQYRIDITVGIASSSDAETTVYEITDIKKYKIVDSSGNVLEEEEFIEEVRGEYEFTFNNIVTEEGTVNLTLYKECSTGHTLAGAKFYITEMNEDGTEVLTNGYFESVTSDSSGVINILGLEKDTYYKIEEYEAPYGHVMREGYWIAYIGPNGFLISIEPMDGADDISSDLTIINDPAEWALLDLTLTKSNELSELLTDVNFNVQRVVINSSGVPEVVVGGYDKQYITDENGSFTITDLEGDHIYMITEKSTPYGHKTHYGYWLIEVSGNALFPSDPLTYTITEYDANHNVVSTVTDDIILNELIEYVLPNTGGVGTKNFYILGIVMMAISLMLLKNKYQRERMR